MSSAKKQMMERVLKDAAAIKARRAAKKEKSIRSHVYDFFKEIGHISQFEAMGHDYMELIVQAANALEFKMRATDPGVVCFVMWSEATEENPHPRAQGIRIEWSAAYAKEQDIDREEHIDISEYLLDF